MTVKGHESVTKQLLPARCNVGIQDDDDLTCFKFLSVRGTPESLIRNNKHKSADRGKKDTLLQASPVQTKKQQEDADRVMKELLEEVDKDAATAVAVS